MRFILLIISVFLSLSFWGQEQEKTKNTPSTNNVNFPTNTETVPASEQQLEEKEEKQLQKDALKKETSSKPQKTDVIQQSTNQFQTYQTQSNTMRSQRTPSNAQQTQMDQAVKKMEVEDKTSFEFNYFKYLSGNYTTAWFNYLKEAEILRPNNSDVQVQMAGYYMITEDQNKALDYLTKLVQSGKLSKDAITYSNDLLKSVPMNGVLITHGYEDTYASTYTQLNSKTRTDIQIISLDFMQSETYRKQLIAKGFKLPSSKIIDIAFMNEFCKLNASKNIAISMTIPKEYLAPLKSNLYTVGLVFEYRLESFNNLNRNEELWTSEFDKLTLKNSTSVKSRELSANYLPMLLILRTSYQATGDTAKLKEIDAIIDTIAVQTNKYEQVKKLKGK